MLRRYKLFGECETADLREQVRAIADAWCEEWLPSSVAVQVQCAPAAGRSEEFEDAQWTRHAADGEEWVCTAADVLAQEALGAALLGGAHGASAIAAELAQEALRGLAAAFLGRDVAVIRHSAGVAGAPPEGLWLPGSAGLVVRLHVGPIGLRVLVAPGWVLRRLQERAVRAPAGQPLAVLRDATRGATCELRVVAGTARLELRELRELRPGDVIALGRRVEDGLAVELSGRALLEARLGRQRGRRAVALAASRQSGGEHGPG